MSAKGIITYIYIHTAASYEHTMIHNIYSVHVHVVAVVCSEGCKVRGYPAESRTLPGGRCVSGDILRPDNSVAYA